ncbi:MAG TPA: TIGR04255 family protein [Thermoanaerobaculia bacterium]|jgi:uncharacterized protein (TIGR04255 family)|nr:TIGR04255 family protein [Thermoanaerobaculia bacterium]HQN10257.1 TIGR04255 family protein [Thermoanaerobaculia bacterium]HQP86746.1 TIGR04255 family protein [Thermoanaerobaculia bacterium]
MRESSRLANAPLVEVVFEIRFPGNFAVYAGLDRFQRALGPEFPSLFVPKAAAGEPLALKPFQWKSEDGSRSVNVALNVFSYMSRRYGVFEEFKTEFRRLSSMFFEIHRPDSLTRLGLRYVNIFPAMECTAEALHPWLELGLRLPALGESEASEVAAAFLLKRPGGTLRLAFGEAAPSDFTPIGPAGVRLTGFALDFDFFRVGPAVVGDIDPFLDEGHQTIETLFFSMVKPEALRVMEGKG